MDYDRLYTEQEFTKDGSQGRTQELYGMHLKL